MKENWLNFIFNFCGIQKHSYNKFLKDCSEHAHANYSNGEGGL